MTDPWGYLNSQPEPDAAPDPWGYLDLDGQVRRAAQRHGVDPGLLGAMVHQESAGDPRAVSAKGARGLLQVMPDTARGLGYRPEDMADPEKNLDAGAAYMGQMLKRYGGDQRLALAAYNAGPGAVDKHGGVPPYQETQNYVRQIQAKVGPPADPWGYLSAPPADTPREKPPTPAAPPAPAWAFSPSGDLSPGLGGLLSAASPSEWEPTGSPLVQKRRRQDGSYETRPTPKAGQEPAVGVEPEPGIGARLGALANRGITAAAEGIASLPDLAALLSDGPSPSASMSEEDIAALPERPVPTSAYAQIGKPGGFFDLQAGRADIHRQYQEAKDTLRTLPPVNDQPPWAVALADTIGEAGQLLPFGEGAKAAHGALPAAEGEKVLARALTGPGAHNAEELALLARREKIMPTVPGAEAPFVGPGAVADSLRPESKILGIGEHATEADQLQALGMRAAPEDARALEQVSAQIGEPGWVPPERPDPWGYLGKPAEPIVSPAAKPVLLSEPPAVSLERQIVSPGPAGVSPRMVPVRAADSAVTERGTRIGFDYQVREAADLVTSHDDALRPRADFPAELQPRDRSRITSEAQVSRIEKNLDPEQLGASPQASNGAPIIGPDGVVESGNARSIALRRAYRSGSEPAAGYRAWLSDNAPRFGVDPAEIASMREPVLVRVRTTDVDRAAFAREANESAVARMSAPELAAMDAERITPEMLDSLRIGESGVNWQGARDFVRSFVQGSNPADLGTMFDARGLLSAEGQRRMQNAVLAKAYGDPEAVAQLVEHADSNVRNVGNALLQQAPRYARLRSGVAAGALHPLDISGDLGGALRKLSGLREAGVKVPDYLAQGGLFGSELGPEGRGLLAMFDANSRSAAKVSDVLGRYADHVEALGHPGQAGLFGAVEVPSKLDLLTRAAGDAQGDLFHQPAPLAAAVREISPALPAAESATPPRLLTMEDVLPPAEDRATPLSLPERPAATPPPPRVSAAPIAPELPPGITTGTKHAVTRAERAAAGLPEVERLAARESPSWEEAKAIYNDNPESARVLAEHVRKNPRQLTDVENDVLLHDRMTLTLDYREALAKEEAALKGTDRTAAALATESRKAIEAAHTANAEALDKAGTVWGRAGQARQKLAAEDYSAVNLNRRYAVANAGEEAPAAVRQKLADLSSQLEAAQARAAAAEEKAQQLQASRLIAEEQRQAGKASRSGARAKSNAQLEAEYKDLGAQLRKATHIQANLNPEQVAVLARQVRNRVQAGVTNLGELVDTIYTDAKPFITDLEPRDVRDVIAGAGQTPKATRSQLTKDLARLKSQSKLLNKLDDVYKGQGLPPSAVRAAPSPEVAALREKLGQVTEDLKLKPALSDQQRLTRIQRALETKIERVERGILPARRAKVSSPEVEALRKTLEQRLEEEGVLVGHDTRVKAALANAEERLKAPGLDPHTRELLRGEVDRWKAEIANPTPGRGPLTEAERLAGSLKRNAAQQAELKAQIAAGEFPSRARAPIPADEALLKARGEIAGLRRQADRIIAAREAANRTGLQKAMDWTPGWGRFIKLSGVSTLQKLGAAAAERSLIFRPLEEFLGGGLSKLPLVRHFAAEAPIEGGASLSALAKNYAGFFGKQAREESMALLKGGEGPLDLAFGKVHDSPTTPAWMSYPGKVHGAIKAPAKVAGYQYAIEKQAQWYLARGEGDQLLSPLVQEEMKARAWEHAQRDIFMGDNAFVSAFQEALRDKPGQTQVTKAVKSGGRVLFPIVKVPTNYALELTDYAAGIPKAGLRMAGVVRAGAKATAGEAGRTVAELVRAGLQEVGPEEAGLIMRQLKKGTLGAGLIALGATGVVKGGGYYEPGKHRSPRDLQPGELSIAGMRVPHMILHHPAIEALQIGAEIHRQRTIGEGLKDAARGVAEGVPFYGEIAQTGRQDLGQFLGGIERGLSIPPDVQRLARVMDQRGGPGAGEKFLQELGWIHIDANRRKPHGGPLERLMKEEMLGLPGARPLVRAPTPGGYDGSGDSYPTIISMLQETGWNPQSVLRDLPPGYVNPDVEDRRNEPDPFGYGPGPDDWKPTASIADRRETDAGVQWRPNDSMVYGAKDAAGNWRAFSPHAGGGIDWDLLREIERKKREAALLERLRQGVR